MFTLTLLAGTLLLLIFLVGAVEFALHETPAKPLNKN